MLLQLFSYALDCVLPGILCRVLMKKFNINNEEVGMSEIMNTVIFEYCPIYFQAESVMYTGIKERRPKVSSHSESGLPLSNLS